MRASAMLLLAVCLGVPLPASGQQATEQFIPIGRSPGLSPAHTWLGPIESVDAEARTLVVASRAVRVGERTHIWLDRTALGESNRPGGLSDCLPGRTAEVRFEAPGESPNAVWIKLRIERSADPPAPEPSG